MTEPTNCPNMQALQEYVMQRMADDAAQRIRQHVDSCQKCAATMSALESQYLGPTDRDSWLDDAASDPIASTQVLDGPRPRISSDDSARFDFDLLDPIEGSDLLGRLGNYEIESILGHGGMGVVFLAFDQRLRRQVAIKTLNRQLATSPTSRRRFIREARAAAAINHPNVITIHAVEEFADQPFLVMEYVRDGTLSDRLRREGRLTPTETLRLSAQIAAGLAAAHAQGVIHRDVKPGNIMLEDGLDRVRISDFGLARVTLDNLELTSKDLTVGTPAYMAPEQVAGEDVDARTDLFALGCVMYAMLTGQSPFQGNQAIVMAHKIAEYDPPPLEEVNRRVPHFFSEIVKRLLQKDPKHRFQTAAEVSNLLNDHLAAINQMATDAEGTVIYQQTRKRPSSFSFRAVSAALLVLLAIAMGTVWFTGNPQEPTASQTALPASGTVGLTDRSTPSPAPIASKLTVSQTDPNADYREISAALAAAGPKTVIEILDDAVYDESIFLNDPERLAGVEIRGAGTKMPTLTCNDSLLMGIQETPDVVICNLKFRPRTNHQHAIAISGLCPGVTIDNVDIAVDDSEWAMVYFTNFARGDAGRPIRFTNSRLDSPVMGLVAQGGESKPLSYVEITDNTFSGDGVHVQLNTAIQSAVVRGNVFIDGEIGVALGLSLPDASGDILVANNTFWHDRHWLHIRASSPMTRDVRCLNNLVLETGDNVIGSDLHSISLFLNRWQFSNNYWEMEAPSDSVELLNHVATIHSRINLLSRDPSDTPNFLRLPADSPLATAGVKGDMPSYVGAYPPKGVSAGLSD